ncbi:centriolar satellite-associated tubulin polyglutamylase complex regulator 1-like isoform X1 [Mytilus galloprovincialis]|uniref:centriolar satellite-associated tubulin polyglutamylase complex regulator 1-like isoform X1 n=1 Tax=Mytilus edulis TaxID=6550 RepID=UPI0039EF833C
MSAEDRFSMSAEKYLAKHNILIYFEDSIAQLLEHREENPKLNSIKFLSEYFNALRDGNHTMFREYSFVHVTSHNRASFVRLFWKCYRQIGKKGDLLSVNEYHSLLTLLCPDFPFEIVQKTARIILLDDAMDCLISFSDFIYAFQIQFYYEEFIEKVHDQYQSLIQTQRSPRDPVVVPSGTDDTSIHQNSHHPADGVDAMQYFRAVFPLCDRSNYSTPPANSLKEILFNVPRVSFYGFLMAMAKSESINDHIGRLPTKSELLEGADSELTTEADSSPTIRLKARLGQTPSPSPETAPVSQNHAQNVYSTKSSHTVTSRPPSAARAKTLVGKGNRAPVVKKKESSDESSDSDTDSSDDTI